MSILWLLAQRVDESPAWQLGLSLGATTAALGVAGVAGVFRRDSVVGPTRVSENERPSTLWMILLIGFSSWLLVSAAYASARASSSRGNASANAGTSTTAPSSTAPAPTTQVALSQEEQVFLGIAGNSAAMAALLFANASLRRHGLHQLGLDRPAFKRMALPAITSIIIVIPLMYVVSLVTQEFWQWIQFDHPDAHPLLDTFREQPSTMLRTMIVISAVVLAPIAEELLFRGHLQTAILHTLNPKADSSLARWTAIVLTSIAFAAVHQQLWMMPPIFFLSLCLGYAYERTGNLWVSMSIHSAFNLVNITYFLWSRIVTAH